MFPELHMSPVRGKMSLTLRIELLKVSLFEGPDVTTSSYRQPCAPPGNTHSLTHPLPPPLSSPPHTHMHTEIHTQTQTCWRRRRRTEQSHGAQKSIWSPVASDTAEADEHRALRGCSGFLQGRWLLRGRTCALCKTPDKLPFPYST
ncbi:unnamed protein product [Pleuronectes platessa]|uniref:Uncharacterized protein n=1 Tax=Pleuronectes platessa TaxID=8262 RepID=A0A9N7TPR7_PLEPL|nr:unnamed protein product [Pleuronectes platessa]